MKSGLNQKKTPMIPTPTGPLVSNALELMAGKIAAHLNLIRDAIKEPRAADPKAPGANLLKLLERIAAALETAPTRPHAHIRNQLFLAGLRGRKIESVGTIRLENHIFPGQFGYTGPALRIVVQAEPGQEPIEALMLYDSDQYHRHASGSLPRFYLRSGTDTYNSADFDAQELEESCKQLADYCRRGNAGIGRFEWDKHRIYVATDERAIAAFDGTFQTLQNRDIETI